MKIRLMGLPTEVNRAVKALQQSANSTYSKSATHAQTHGTSRQVRVYVEIQLTGPPSHPTEIPS